MHAKACVKLKGEVERVELRTRVVSLAVKICNFPPEMVIKGSLN